LLPIKLSMSLQKRGVWGAAPARGVWGGGAPPSQKIYNCFHFIKIRPIKETPDIFWMPSASCYFLTLSSPTFASHFCSLSPSFISPKLSLILASHLPLFTISKAVFDTRLSSTSLHYLQRCLWYSPFIYLSSLSPKMSLILAFHLTLFAISKAVSHLPLFSLCINGPAFLLSKGLYMWVRVLKESNLSHAG